MKKKNSKGKILKFISGCLAAMLMLSGVVSATPSVTYAVGGVITDVVKITDDYGKEPQFTINDELGTHTGICINFNAKIPAAGSSLTEPVLSTNDALRRVLYYGYGGPGDLGVYGWTFTAMAASSAMGNIPMKDGVSVGDHYTLSLFPNQPVPPSNFQVYVVSTNDAAYQPMAYWVYEPQGAAYIQKSSANTSITTGNNCYSLKNAIYGIYSSSSCTDASMVTKLATDENGKTLTAPLEPGTYYVKEITAPKGYLLDTTVYPCVVTSGKTTAVAVKDVPGNDPIGIELTKIDKVTGNKVQGDGDLSGAEFTICYYDGYYNASNLPSNPTRRWIISTKYNTIINSYETRLSEDYKVTGDDFYYVGNEIVLPLGTITIEETKAPNGYTLEGAVFTTSSGTPITGKYVAQITSTNSGVSLVGGNVLTVSDSVIRGGIELQKIDGETGNIAQGSATLAGAEFTIYNRNNCSVIVNGIEYASGEAVLTLTTDAGGYAASAKNALPYGDYEISETKAPDGYILDSTPRSFSITTDGEMVSFTGDDAFKNTIIKGYLKLEKTDSETGEPLAGAEFGIYSDKDCTKLIQTLVTDENGEAVSKSLVEGMYYVKELKAPAGYATSVTVYSASIAPAKVTTVKVENTAITVTIEKICSETGKHIIGAELIISDSEGNEIERWISANKPHVIKPIPVGTYTLTEIRAPFGYQVSETVEFTVSDTNEPQIITMKDAETYGKAIINKTDEDTGEPLEGVTFEIKVAEDVLDSDGNIAIKAGTVMDTIVTDKNGYAESKLLPIGTYGTDGWISYIKYTLQETKTLEGYSLDNTIHEIQFDYADDKTPIVEKVFDITNEVMPVEPPKTGDYTATALWLTIILTAVAVVASIYYNKLKDRMY